MTLTEFLLARIAEDEAVALTCVIPAHEEPGAYQPHPELAEWLYTDGDEVIYKPTEEMLAHRYYSPFHVTCDTEGLLPSIESDVGHHVARHDPARVLCECEAKRRIVEHATQCDDSPRGGWCYSCHVALCALASVYSDHPDYDPAWA